MSTLMKFELAPDVLNFQYGADYPARRVDRILQINDRTAGGTFQTETLGISIKERTLSFTAMPEVDYVALLDWHINVVNGSEKSFTFTDEKGFVGDVIITDSEINFIETDFELYAGTITLEYV